MRKILNNNKGGLFLISTAVIIAMVSLISTFNIILLVRGDSLNLSYQLDKIQEELLLRSESSRSRIAIGVNENFNFLPRIVKMTNGDFASTYTIQTSIDNTELENFMGFPTAKAKAIRSLPTSKRRNSQAKVFESPIRRYSEKLLRNESLAQYQYFTDIECSENCTSESEDDCDVVKFWGGDEFHGKVHSNDNIYCQQQYPPNPTFDNEGWPLFHDPVSTAKQFMKWPTLSPMTYGEKQQVFQGGWTEYEGEGGHIIFNPTADDIQTNGVRPFDPSMEIVYVKISGSTYESWYGDVEFVEVDSFGVYSWYPTNTNGTNYVVENGGNWYEDSDHIWTNRIPIYDTTWIPGPPGNVSNNSVYVESELWIEGVVGGKQTWGCADTIFIVGDITYSGTDPGDPPDEEDTMNYSDYFGLVSEKKILLRYKHRDPDTNIVMDHNCYDVVLYGAYAAIGSGIGNEFNELSCHHDGIFTFQYQHPHGSTPDFWAHSPYLIEEYTIRMIDTGNDGWNDSTIDVLVNGELVLNDITCYGAENSEIFTVENGDMISVVYSAGTNSNENEHLYELLDGDDNVVASDGPNPGPGIMYQVLIDEYQDTLYTYIDLHKFIFPKSSFAPENIEPFNLHGSNTTNPSGYPTINPYLYAFPYAGYPNNDPTAYAYPDGTDYPWYNPVWPEPWTDIVFERGTLSIFGSIAQRRRGFIHRSGGDDNNHPNPSEWDMEEYFFDGDHPSTGYNKNYHYDKRFLVETPPDYPQIYFGHGDAAFAGYDEESWNFKTPPKN